MQKEVIEGLCNMIRGALETAQARLEINDYDGEEAEPMQDVAAALAAFDDLAPIIAAAPAMLAALRLIYTDDDGDGYVSAEGMGAVRAAIAAATGAPTDETGAACPTDEKRGPGLWRIVHGEPLTIDSVYWSNRTGWGGLAGSDGFSDAERARVNLPMGGAWWFDSDEDETAAATGERWKAGLCIRF